MDGDKKSSITSQRIKSLRNQLNNKEFRDGYVESHVKMFIAEQIKFLRSGKTQKEFAKLIGTTQSVISRLENPEYGKVTIQTLLEIASKLDIALIVRFANYAEFLVATDDFSEQALKPSPYSDGCFDLLEKVVTTSNEQNMKSYITIQRRNSHQYLIRSTSESASGVKWYARTAKELN